jgi:hypothetical protein
MFSSRKTAGAVLAALVLGGLASTFVTTEARVLAPCPEVDPTVPIVMLETAGFGFGGAIHRRLTVYSNGLATYSEAGGGVLGPASSHAAFTHVDAADVAKLRKDLRQAGVFELCDLEQIVADIPMTQITAFRGKGADLEAHTYSYYFAQTAAHSAVEGILNALITKYFPPSVNDG